MLTCIVMARTNKEPRPEIYRLSLTDDKTHRQLWAFSFSRFGFLATVVTILFVLTAAIASIISFTPLKTLLPGYPDAHTRQEAIRNAIRKATVSGSIRAITPSRIPTLGRTAKVALAVMTRFIFRTSIPSAFPAR